MSASVSPRRVTSAQSQRPRSSTSPASRLAQPAPPLATLGGASLRRPTGGAARDDSLSLQRAKSKSLPFLTEDGDDGFAWPFAGDARPEADAAAACWPLRGFRKEVRMHDAATVGPKDLTAGAERTKRVRMATAADDTDEVGAIVHEISARPSTPVGRFAGHGLHGNLDAEDFSMHDQEQSGTDDNNDEARIDNMLERLNQLARMASKATGIRVSFKSDRESSSGSYVSNSSVVYRTSGASSASFLSRHTCTSRATRKHTGRTTRFGTAATSRSRAGTQAEALLHFDSMDEASRPGSVSSHSRTYTESDTLDSLRSSEVGELSSSASAPKRPGMVKRADSMQVMQMIERLTKHIAEPSPRSRAESDGESETWSDEVSGTRRLSPSNPFRRAESGGRPNEAKALRSVVAERDAEVKALQNQLREVRATLDTVLAQSAEAAAALVADAEGAGRCWLLIIRGTPPVAELVPLARGGGSRDSSQEFSPAGRGGGWRISRGATDL